MKDNSIYYSDEAKRLWYNKLKVDKYFAPIGLILYIILQIFTIYAVFRENSDMSIYIKSIPQMILWIIMLVFIWWQTPKLTKQMDDTLISLKNSCSEENIEKYEAYAVKVVSHKANSIILFFFVMVVNIVSHEIIPFITDGVDSFNRILFEWTGINNLSYGIPHHFIDLVQLLIVMSFYGTIFTRIVDFIIISMGASKYLDKINIYHEDGAAGLGKIGEFIYSFVKIAVVLIILVMVFAFGWYILIADENFWRDLYIMSCIPVVMLLCLFFIPQISIHKVLLREKTERKKNIAVALQELDELILSGKENNADIDINQVRQKIEIVQTFRKVISSIPNWPFRLDQLLKVILASLSPLITVFVSYLLESVFI